MTTACSCDTHGDRRADNPPGLARVSARRDDWRSIRRALLQRQDGETALGEWHPGDAGDLAVMIVEWWALLGEILEFYTDEIANEAFLPTARQTPSAARLVSLLGYRPRPPLAASATLAALVDGRDAITLPQGFAIDSVPGPGQPPQTFELITDTVLPPGGRMIAQPVLSLAAPVAGLLLLEGKVRGVAVGDRLRLVTPAGDYLLTVAALSVGSATTELRYTATTAPPATLRARDCRLERFGQSLPAWTMNGAALVGSVLHLAVMTRAIVPGMTVLIDAPGRTPILSRVDLVGDVVWWANVPDQTKPGTPPAPGALPIPHTALTLATPPTGWEPATIAVGMGWIEVARLLDQPPAAWTGTPETLEAIGLARFAGQIGQRALIAAADGRGVPGALSSSAGAATADATIDAAYLPATLDAPLDLLTNLIAVSRGKTVPHELLGSGDARLAGQSFVLAKAPVSYDRRGAGYASSVTILIDGIPWTEVESFYGQPATAVVFTLAEREDGRTVVAFGDGVEGRRLPSGRDNVVARYRYGAGADTPAPGKLTRIAKSWPGLAKVLNPVAAHGGADGEAGASIRRHAPRSMLTLGRAVSVADFAAVAATAAAPFRSRASWAWDETRQRAAVTIWVAGDAGVRAAVRSAIDAVGDPHQPVSVQPATAVPVGLALGLLIAPGYETAPIEAAVHDVLTGDDGLFHADRLGIGQPLFRSAITAAIVALSGVVTITTLDLFGVAGGGHMPMNDALVTVEEGQWLDLTADRVWIGMQHDG